MRNDNRLRHRGAVVVLLSLALALFPTLGAGAQGKPSSPEPWEAPVPKAECGPNDRTETGLQGQTTLAERESGASEQAYNCNLELVGQYQGEGAHWQMAWFGDCAYYGTAGNPEQENLGVVVVDASDPTNPRPTAHLDDTLAMLNPHESLKVHERRKLLAGVSFRAPNFATYDLSDDCRQPVLAGQVELPDSFGHAGDFAPDGRTYYSGSDNSSPGGRHFFAIDITDPANPEPFLRWPPFGESIGAPHDLSISKDGTRAYLAKSGRPPPAEVGPTGLIIVDVSDIQSRSPDPQPSVVSELLWDDGAVSQQTIPVTFRGRPHLIFTDETGAGAFGGHADACDRGLAPFGFARIIDITDERNPRTISKLMLEVNDPEIACPEVLNDFPPGAEQSYGYSTHYCEVDKVNNPRLLACSYMQAGVRVFDISNPYRPREIAYYKPPAQRTAFLPGSTLWGPDADRTADRVGSQIRINRYRGETHLWFIGQDTGFQILRFTNDVLKGQGKRQGKDRAHPGKGRGKGLGKDRAHPGKGRGKARPGW